MMTLRGLLERFNRGAYSIPQIEQELNDWLMVCEIDTVSVAKTSVDNWFKGRSKKVGRGRGEGEPLCLALAHVLGCSRVETDQLLLFCGYRTVQKLMERGQYGTLTKSWVNSTQAKTQTVPDHAFTQEDNSVPVASSLPPTAYFDLLRNRYFAGRDQLLQQISTQLKLPATQGVVLCGPAGIGKTQLAAEYVYRHSAEFSGGIFLIRCEQPMLIDLQIANCGRVSYLDLHPNFDALQLRDQVALVQRAWRSPTPRLLILDHVEQPIALLRHIMPLTGGCKLLITSRHAEWGTMPMLAPIVVSELGSEASRTLLQRLDNGLTNEMARKLAAALGYHPLTLATAGRYLQFARRLGDEADVLLRQIERGTLFEFRPIAHETTYNPPEYPTPLVDLFASIVDQLDVQDPIDAAARQLLPVIAVLSEGGPVPLSLLQIASTYFGIAKHTLLHAVSRMQSLGLVVESARTVAMQQLFRQFVLWRLGVPKNLVAVFAADRLADFLGDVPRWVAVRSQIGALVPYVEQHVAVDSAEWLLQLGELLTDRHLLALGERCLSAAQQMVDLDPDLLNQMQLAVLQFTIGRNHGAAGRLAASQLAYAQCVAMLRTLLDADDPRLAEIDNSLAYVAMRLGALDSAEQHLNASLQIKRQYPDHRHALAIAHSNLGLLAHLRGDLQSAEREQTLAIELKRELLQPDPVALAVSYARVAAVQQATGQSKAAEQSLHAAIRAWEIGYGPDNPAVAHRLQQLALIYRANRLATSATFLLAAAHRLFVRMLGEDSAEAQACAHFLQ